MSSIFIFQNRAFILFTAMTYRFKDINKLAIPAIISGIAEPLLSLTDTAIVGNIPNDSINALAAVGIAGSFISAIVCNFDHRRYCNERWIDIWPALGKTSGLNIYFSPFFLKITIGALVTVVFMALGFIYLAVK